MPHELLLSRNYTFNKKFFGSWHARLKSFPIHLRYWRDHAGPEVDYVLEFENQYIPIEVKWTNHPLEKDYLHMKKFLGNYPHTKKAFIVCQTSQWLKLTNKIIAIPWQDIPEIL